MSNNPNLSSFDVGVQSASDTQKLRLAQMSQGLEQERQEQRQKLQDQRQAIFDQIKLQQHQMNIENHQRAIENDKRRAVLDNQRITEGEQKQQELQQKQAKEDQNVYTKALLNSQGFSDSEVAEKLGIMPNLPENYSKNLDTLIPLLDKAVADLSTDKEKLAAMDSKSIFDIESKGKNLSSNFTKDSPSKIRGRLASIDKNFSLDDLIKSNGDLSAFLGSHYGKEVIDSFIKERVPNFNKLREKEKNALRAQAKNEIAQTYSEATGNLGQLVQTVMGLGGEKTVASIYNKFLSQGGLRNVRNREEMVKALRRAVGFSNDPRVLQQIEELNKLPKNLNELRPDHPIYTTPPPLPPRGLQQVDASINQAVTDVMKRPEVQEALESMEEKPKGYAENMKKYFKDAGYPDDMVEQVYQDALAREITGSLILTPVRDIVNGALNLAIVPATNKVIDASNALTDTVSKAIGSKVNKFHISDETKRNVRDFLHWTQSEAAAEFAREHPNVATAADLVGWIGLGVASGGAGLGLGIASEAASAGGAVGGAILRAARVPKNVIEGMEAIGAVASKAISNIKNPVLKRAILWAADQGVLSGVAANANTEGDVEFSERMKNALEGGAKGAAIGAGFSLAGSALGKIAGRILSRPLRQAGAKESFTEEIVKRGEQELNKKPNLEEDLSNITSKDEINARQVDIQDAANKGLKVVEDRKKDAVNAAVGNLKEAESKREKEATEEIKARQEALKQGRDEEGANYNQIAQAFEESYNENKNAIPKFNKKYKNELKEVLPEEASSDLLDMSSNLRQRLDKLMSASESNFYVASGSEKLKNIASNQRQMIYELERIENPSELDRQLVQDVKTGEVFKKSYDKNRLNYLKGKIRSETLDNLEKNLENQLTYKDMLDLYRANNAKFGAGDFEKGVGRNLRASLQKLFKDKDTTSKFFKDFENSNESYRLGLIQEKIAKPNEENPTLDAREPKFKGRGKEILERLARNPEFTSEPLFVNKRMQENLEREIALERIAKPTRTKPFTEVDDDLIDDFDDNNDIDIDTDQRMLPAERQKAIDQGILRELIYDIEKGKKSPEKRIREYEEALKEGGQLSSILEREPEIREAMEDRVQDLNNELEMLEDLINDNKNLSEEAEENIRKIANEIAESEEYKKFVEQINQLTKEMKEQAASDMPKVSEMLRNIYEQFQDEYKIPEVIDALVKAREKNVVKYKKELENLKEQLKKIREIEENPEKFVDDIAKELLRNFAANNLGIATRIMLFLSMRLGQFAVTKDVISQAKNRAAIELAKDIFRRRFGKEIPESDIDKLTKALYNSDKLAQFLVTLLKLFSMVVASPDRNDDDQ